MAQLRITFEKLEMYIAQGEGDIKLIAGGNQWLQKTLLLKCEKQLNQLKYETIFQEM